MATAYYQEWLAKADSAIKLAAFALQEGEEKDAAFLFHQAAERAYICYLLEPDPKVVERYQYVVIHAVLATRWCEKWHGLISLGASIAGQDCDIHRI